MADRFRFEERIRRRRLPVFRLSEMYLILCRSGNFGMASTGGDSDHRLLGYIDQIRRLAHGEVPVVIFLPGRSPSSSCWN